LKGDKFSSSQRPKNALEKKEMKNIPYAYVVGSLMHAHVCLRPEIACVVGMLGRYQSNSGMEHWKATKEVMRYLQETKNHMLTYKHIVHPSTLGYVFMLMGGAISWKSIKHSVLEAEFIASFEASFTCEMVKEFYRRASSCGFNILSHYEFTMIIWQLLYFLRITKVEAEANILT